MVRASNVKFAVRNGRCRHHRFAQIIARFHLERISSPDGRDRTARGGQVDVPDGRNWGRVVFAFRTEPFLFVKRFAG